MAHLGVQVPCREFNVHAAFTHMFSEGSAKRGPSIGVARKENADAYGYNSKAGKQRKPRGIAVTPLKTNAYLHFNPLQ